MCIIELTCLKFAFLGKFCVREDFVGPTSQYRLNSYLDDMRFGSIALLLDEFIDNMFSQLSRWQVVSLPTD